MEVVQRELVKQVLLESIKCDYFLLTLKSLGFLDKCPIGHIE